MNAPNRTAECDWKPALYNKGAAFVYSDEYTKPVLDLLSAKPGERIVDLGCGTGELTLRIERIVGPEGLVLGIDSNESMLEKAKANGLKNSILCDIQDLAIPNEFKHLTGTFDAVFTNAVLHWCKRDPRGVVRGAKALLKPGGRFIGDFGGYMAALGLRSVVAQILKSRGKPVHEPCFLPRAEEYKKILESEGFRWRTSH